ncbi:unnamed protein product, partial [Didymodactylos carnosus]
NTFDRMYSKMDTLWKFHRYHIIKEYTILSPLPPPLNLLSSGNYHQRPFNPELLPIQILNLRRREALAYETDIFDNLNKSKQTDIMRSQRLDVQLQKLKKLLSHIKITCEAHSQM